jgi:hypothetical protein
VTAILGCTAFLGLIFGFIALSQIKRTGDRGPWPGDRTLA